MALHSSRRTQDQNLNIHFDVKTNGSIAQKNRGGLGRRNALSDLPHSVKPQQAHQGIKKRSKGKQTETVVAEDESKNSGKPMINRRRALNDISNIGKPNKRTQGKKRTIGSIAQKNSQIRVSGRKALSDLTNSAKPKKRTQGKQMVTVVAEDEHFPCSIAEEGFLHNHDECIQSQKKSTDLDQFSEFNNRFDEDVCFQSISPQSKEENPKLWPTSPIFFSETEEETPKLRIQRRRPLFDQTSPICGSPNSLWQPYDMKDDDIFPGMMDFNLPYFILRESPRSSK